MKKFQSNPVTPSRRFASQNLVSNYRAAFNRVHVLSLPALGDPANLETLNGNDMPDWGLTAHNKRTLSNIYRTLSTGDVNGIPELVDMLELFKSFLLDYWAYYPADYPQIMADYYQWAYMLDYLNMDINALKSGHIGICNATALYLFGGAALDSYFLANPDARNEHTKYSMFDKIDPFWYWMAYAGDMMPETAEHETFVYGCTKQFTGNL